ncbi:polysaccharide biosynthesis C-terminal domain-containing protein [Singulisphaera sp. Ch08]|uniref:Polysaccharide biosynthesis C-terminal domain-containing protein n=1 Tax=Singulisphaera sp. Ch08 TaxID=3120278 RepID=A0AAU7CL52_9BACT
MSVQTGPDEIVATTDSLSVSLDPGRLSRLKGFLRETSTGSSFRGRVGLTTVANLAQGLIGLATGVTAARLLGPQGRGELASIQTWPLLLASLAMIGMPEAVVYFASRSRERAGQYLATALVMVLGAGVAMGIAGWWLMPWLLHAQSPAIIHAARLFLPIIALYAIAGLPHHMLRALGAWRSWNLFRLLPSLLWMGVLLAAFLSPRLASPIILSKLALTTTFVTIIPLVLVLRRQSCGPYVPRGEYVRPLVHYGLPSMLNVLPQTLNLRLDQMMMTAALEPTLLGLYVIAVAWSGMLSPLVSSVGTVLFPHLSAIGDHRQQRATMLGIARRLVVAVVVLTIVLLILTPFVFPLLFGSRFNAAIPAALILVVASGFSTLNSTFEASLQGLGRPMGVLVAEVVGLVMTLVLLLVLLPPFGIVGAAIASLVAYMMTTILLVAQLSRVLRQTLPAEGVSG